MNAIAKWNGFSRQDFEAFKSWAQQRREARQSADADVASSQPEAGPVTTSPAVETSTGAPELSAIPVQKVDLAPTTAQVAADTKDLVSGPTETLAPVTSLDDAAPSVPEALSPAVEKLRDVVETAVTSALAALAGDDEGPVSLTDEPDDTGKVNALDYARRAAIETSLRLATQSMIAGMAEAPFATVPGSLSRTTDAYATGSTAGQDDLRQEVGV